MEHLVFRWITSIEYYYHVFAGALHCYLEIMEKIQEKVHWATGPTFDDSLDLQKIIEM